MTRLFLSICLVACLLALLPVLDARAVEMPTRKAGLWEMKVVRTGSPIPEMTMQHCTDESTDKEMSTTFSPMAKEMCSKQDIQKTAAGYVSDSRCKVGAMSITSHSSKAARPREARTSFRHSNYTPARWYPAGHRSARGSPTVSAARIPICRPSWCCRRAKALRVAAMAK